jgi:ribosomal protein S7
MKETKSIYELAVEGHHKEIAFIDEQIEYGIERAGEWQRHIDKLTEQKAALIELWEQRSRILLDDPKPPPGTASTTGGKKAAPEKTEPEEPSEDDWAKHQPEQLNADLTKQARAHHSLDPFHVRTARNYDRPVNIEDEKKQRIALEHVVQEALTDWTKGTHRKDSPEIAAASLYWCLIHGVKNKELPTGRPVSLIPYLKKHKFNNCEASIRLRVWSKLSLISGILWLGVRGPDKSEDEFIPAGGMKTNCNSTMVILDPDLKNWEADDIVDALMVMHRRVANNPLTVLENLNASELPRQFAAHYRLRGADPQVDRDKSDRFVNMEDGHGKANNESEWSRWRAATGLEFVKVADFWWNDKGFSAHVPVRFLTQRRERREAKARAKLEVKPKIRSTENS